LNGEKIDIIEDVEDEHKLVMDSLKPAKITSVKIENGKATVQLPEDQKALAIGKGAVNVKLASQLT